MEEREEILSFIKLVLPKSSLILLGAIVLMYLIFGFIGGQMNPFAWHGIARFFYVLLTLLIGGAGIALYVQFEAEMRDE